jgi:hypothetical protein
MPDHHVTLGRPELDNIGPVVLRAVDHDPILAHHRHFLVAPFFLGPRFTAGASIRVKGQELGAGLIQALHRVRDRLVSQRTGIIKSDPRLLVGAWRCRSARLALPV